MAGGTSTHGIIAVDNSPASGHPLARASYKGLAIATDRTGATFLYAADFRIGQVEIYDGTFKLLRTFTDLHLPANYAPFNVVPIKIKNEDEDTLEDRLVVAFAVKDAAGCLQPPSRPCDDVAGQGHGIVDTFDLSGNMLQRVAQGGALNSPWGVALAPQGFGELSGKLLIGNFGDGKINAFDPETGGTSVPLNTSAGQPMVLDGLWALKFGNRGEGRTLYFVAGPNGEADGLFGTITPTNGQNAQGDQNQDGQGNQ
jgi:uncharacterized protein (TIGR03118 family)